MKGRKPNPDSQFDDFLYAPIVEESNGTLLTVLSALAREDLNPWEEAARLALLPRDIATSALAKLILALPNGLPQGLDAGAMARQLIGRLPRNVPAPVTVAAPASIGGFAIERGAAATLLWIYLALASAFLGAQWLAQGAQAPLRPGTEAPPATGIASSPAQTPAPAVSTSRHD